MASLSSHPTQNAPSKSVALFVSPTSSSFTKRPSPSTPRAGQIRNITSFLFLNLKNPLADLPHGFCIPDALSVPGPRKQKFDRFLPQPQFTTTDRNDGEGYNQSHIKTISRASSGGCLRVYLLAQGNDFEEVGR